jgi:hypothetical protein
MAKDFFFVVCDGTIEQCGMRDEAEQHVRSLVEDEGYNEEDITVIRGVECRLSIVKPVKCKVTLSG